jgi:hypothetical protein
MFEAGEHHLELLSWEAMCSPDLMDHPIEQVLTPRVQRAHRKDKAIPRGIRTTWYWVAPPNFQGVDALYCRVGTVYIIQMTINVEHSPASLSDISDDLEMLRDQGATLLFVTLVDVRSRQWAFRRKHNGMLQPRFWWSKLPQRIGLLCLGPPSGMARTLYDERDDIVDE